jgi:hypothetical protein
MYPVMYPFVADGVETQNSILSCLPSMVCLFSFQKRRKKGIHKMYPNVSKIIEYQ